MDKQIEHQVRNCAACQNSDKTAYARIPPLQPVPLPAQPWHKLAIDINVVPLNTAHRNVDLRLSLWTTSGLKLHFLPTSLRSPSAPCLTLFLRGKGCLMR